MAILFHERDLLVTDERVRTPTREYPIYRVRRAWVSLPESTRGLRLIVTAVLVGVVVAVAGWAVASGWLTDHWVTVPLFIVAAGIAGWAGFLDPLAIYLEKRRHDLYLDVDGVPVRVWSNNKVEVNKAIRAIDRARERHRDAQWR
ncbi:hypothetical protein GCM10009682_09860 [Luedemannella flava]|uniref:PrgI family protein n=1 Tax=Luedemannella flava TaxID=349316 RepID=A0ABN2LIJ9_9ACTN